MAVQEQWGKLDLAGAGQAVLMLDASESARICRQEIVTLARQVLEKLPGRMRRKLYFLGNAQDYDSTRFSAQASRFLQENLSRASLISPVLRAIAPSPDTRIVVIGSGRIFDLDDWSPHEHLKNLLLISMGNPMQIEGGPAMESLTQEADEICQFLCPGTTKVVIGGKGFLPLHWDNDAYSLDSASPEPILVARNAGSYDLTLHYLCEGSSGAQATVSTGVKDGCADLFPSAPVAPAAPLLGMLDTPEVAVFTRASRRQNYNCPLCGREHAWNEVRCQANGGILGARIYRSIPCGFAGLAVFRVVGQTVEAHAYGPRGLPLEPGKVALWNGRQAEVWQFDAADNRWTRCPHERLDPYIRQENGEYVVVL